MKLRSCKMLSATFIIASLAIINGCSQQNNHTIFTPRTDTILIKLMQFSPGDLQARIGDTILWINKDFVAHNVKETANNLFYSDTLNPGNSFKWAVTGKADYICSIHPTMEGKVTISKK